jgi:hypothetical protein
MRFPVVRERTHVEGRIGTFVVLAIHRERSVVDLISVAKGARVETDVPMSSLLRLNDVQARPDRPEERKYKGNGDGSRTP